MQEAEWIDRYIKPLVTSKGAFELTDDVAVLTPYETTIVTMDTLVEAVHFLAADPLDTVGRKLLRVNISDIYAKGAAPGEALLSIAWPRHRDEVEFAALMAGIGDDLEAFNVSLIGGDLVTTDGPLILSLTLTGQIIGPAAIHRNGAKAGDGIFVTGQIGFGDVGLAAAQRGDCEDLAARYRVPLLAPLQAAAAVATHATASMDVSDGLLLDAQRLCKASRVGLVLDLDCVPLAEPSDDLAIVIRQCTGGDDYQILMTAPADRDLTNFTRIGQVVEGDGLGLKWRGNTVDLPDILGFLH
ncbi:MAG: thiamine-phosphate kinase [Henriciella sp.]